jgi:hypothetical protein
MNRLPIAGRMVTQSLRHNDDDECAQRFCSSPEQHCCCKIVVDDGGGQTLTSRPPVGSLTHRFEVSSWSKQTSTPLWWTTFFSCNTTTSVLNPTGSISACNMTWILASGGVLLKVTITAAHHHAFVDPHRSVRRGHNGHDSRRCICYRPCVPE